MYYVGLDLGQKRDYSAVIAIERVDHRRAFQGTEFEKLNVRYIERLPLGTPYPVVVERMREIVGSWPGIALWLWTLRAWGLRWWICCGRLGWDARWWR